MESGLLRNPSEIPNPRGKEIIIQTSELLLFFTFLNSSVPFFPHTLSTWHLRWLDTHTRLNVSSGFHSSDQEDCSEQVNDALEPRQFNSLSNLRQMLHQFHVLFHWQISYSPSQCSVSYFAATLYPTDRMYQSKAPLPQPWPQLLCIPGPIKCGLP